MYFDTDMSVDSSSNYKANYLNHLLNFQKKIEVQFYFLLYLHILCDLV